MNDPTAAPPADPGGAPSCSESGRSVTVEVTYTLTGAPAMTRKYGQVRYQPTKMVARYIDNQLSSINISGKRILKNRMGESVSDSYQNHRWDHLGDNAWAWALVPERLQDEPVQRHHLTQFECAAVVTALGFVEAGGGIDGEPVTEAKARDRAYRKLGGRS